MANIKRGPWKSGPPPTQDKPQSPPPRGPGPGSQRKEKECANCGKCPRCGK